MEPLKKVQVEGHLMFAEPHELFGNLDELCYVRCRVLFRLHRRRITYDLLLHCVPAQ